MNFDSCAIRQLAGGFNLLTRQQFAELQLAERVRLVMAGRVQFLRNGQPISIREALDEESR